MFQVLIAVIFVGIAVIVETTGMHPTGVYVYSHKGYKDFQIDCTKSELLRQINLQKTIRKIRTCGPESKVVKSSRRKLQLVSSLAASDVWICYDRTGKQFLFVFEAGKLKTILLQRLRFGDKQGLELFDICQPEQIRHLDQYLENQTMLKVYPEK